MQGCAYPDLRAKAAENVKRYDADGYAIGGLAVGEPAPVMYEMIGLLDGLLPRDKPRYLMGVGTPANLLEGIERGVDMFDCVLPTRTGRMGTAFSSEGRLNFRNARFAHDDGPIDPTCTCPVCTGGYSRALIRHMVTQKEMLGGILLSMHNIYYLLNLMQRARQAIIEGRYGAFVSDWMNSPAAVDY